MIKVKQTAIREFGKIITGKTPSMSNPLFYDGAIPFVSPKDIDRSKSTILDTGLKITDHALSKHKNQVIPKNSIMYTSLSYGFGKMAFAPEKCMTNQQIHSIIVNEKKFDRHFIFNLLKNQTPYILSFNSGIDTPIVPKSTFEKIKLPVPPLPIQKQIAEILSAYDELIANNTARIQLLEEMAEELYKEWFVRMRFPATESSPTWKDATFYNPQGQAVKHGSPGALPEGWEVGKLGDSVEIKKGKNITKNTIKEGNVPVVAGGLTPAYYHNKANTKSPTITVSASGANAGFVNLYFQNIWASDCSYIDQNSTNNLYYYYNLMKVNQPLITYLQKGSAQPHVYPKDLMKLDVKKPPTTLLQKFSSIVNPMYDEIGILKKKNQILQETRDLLLPRLMSGKLDVSQLKAYPQAQETAAMAAEDGGGYSAQ